MTFSEHDHARAFAAANAGDDSHLMRDYKLMMVEHAADIGGDGFYPAIREYFAIGQGDSDVGESEVYIGTKHQEPDGSWSKLQDDHCCDYDESRAKEVAQHDKLLPSEVVPVFSLFLGGRT